MSRTSVSVAVFTLLLAIFAVAIQLGGRPRPPVASDLGAPPQFNGLLLAFDPATPADAAAIVEASRKVDAARARYQSKRSEAIEKIGTRAARSGVFSVGGTILSGLSMLVALLISLLGASKGLQITGVPTEKQLDALDAHQGRVRNRVLALCALSAFLTGAAERSAAFSGRLATEAKEVAALTERADLAIKQALDDKDVDAATRTLDTAIALYP